MTPVTSDATAASNPAKIEVFGHDVTEISLIRRIRTLRALGHGVHSFTMRRDNMNASFVPDWPNTHLFATENENLLKRAAVVAASVVQMARHRARLRKADLIFARNMDMLAIALAARFMAGAQHVPLAYECLDIHGALCGDDLKSKAMRAAERAMLRRVQMLVVSSPGFIRNYFEPLQDYRGPWVLWENKLAFSGQKQERPNARSASRKSPALKLGWIGTLRCAPSLRILGRVATEMGARVEIHMHGVVHHHALPDFDDVVSQHSNIFFHGAYEYPQDLARVYSSVDLVWAQDLWQSGNNSDWLLPNRIYEASWAGCPSLAVASTETGRRVLQDALGWVIEQPDAAQLVALLKRLTADEITARHQDLLARADTEFVQTDGDLETVIDTLRTNRHTAWYR